MKEYKVKSLLIALISAVLFGIVWELVENLMHITFTAASGYGLDTAMDLLNDTIGGILAYLYFIKRRRGLKADSAILHPFYDQVCVSNKKA